MSLVLNLIACAVAAVAQLAHSQQNVESTPKNVDPSLEPYWQRRAELLRELTTPDLKTFALLAFNAAVMFGLVKDGRALVDKPFFVAAMSLGALSCLLFYGAVRSRLPKNRVRTLEDIDAMVSPTVEWLKQEIFNLDKIRWTKHRFFNWGLKVSAIMLVVAVVGVCW